MFVHDRGASEMRVIDTDNSLDSGAIDTHNACDEWDK